ncbi:phosphate/phosphite/phosphonate ABC transporter substrate-binding protein [Jiangella asiatica]|uniref:Phosphate/phosphite/phosphonate ABC transporter substrate-binding protein n=1 Tax=Jiangella asiatica TaxID=2530372 RepID=A0A4R5DXZ4_9ACTN|nr:phosphate/phosphite/phosphonate ABC transporter substrate-binding protein [Jiangella asiatica]TDE16003.1 phosphate/phosphite/phosphonate ABC transporter substrate-binding protein [Jiangella asiatica]
MTATTTKRRLAASAVAAALGALAAGCSSGSDDETEATAGGFPSTIVLGAIPAENSTDLAAGYDPIVKMLEAETGATVEVSQASDYAGVIEGLIAGNVDMAFLGSFAYVIATENDADITPLGAVTAAKDEEPGYFSYGIAQGDNAEISDLADFAGKDVCFVDPGSTSGFLYPSAGLIEAGVVSTATESAMAEALNPIFAGAHDASALAVKNGDCDAGFAMQSMVDRTLIESGELAEGDLKTVWESPQISGSLFVARDGLGEDVVAELTTLMTEKANADYLLGEGFCEGDCLLTDEDAWGVKPATDADYDGVREVCRLTESAACEG